MPNQAIQAIALSYNAWLTSEEIIRQKQILLCRNYYEGDQKVPLSARQQEYLGFSDSGRFCDNHCRTVVDAPAEKMIFQKFTGKDETFTTWANNLWQSQPHWGRLYRKVQRSSLRDGEWFVFVDFNNDIRFIPHPRYTDPTAGGSGFGMKAHYQEDDPDRDLEYVSKRWTEPYTNERGQPDSRQRMNLYYPDRIERYETTARSGWTFWTPYSNPQAPAIMPWPLGVIPIVHIQNQDLRSEIWDAIPIQDAINKTLLDALAVADASGFPILTAIGFYPTSDGLEPAADGSNYLKISPGCWIATTNQDASIGSIPPSNLDVLLNLHDRLCMELARVTDTPLSRLQLTRQVIGAETIKASESSLNQKAIDRQDVFGDDWEACLYIARRYANLYQAAGLDEDASLEAVWQPTGYSGVVSELEPTPTAKIKEGPRWTPQQEPTPAG